MEYMLHFYLLYLLPVVILSQSRIEFHDECTNSPKVRINGKLVTIGAESPSYAVNLHDAYFDRNEIKTIYINDSLNHGEIKAFLLRAVDESNYLIGTWISPEYAQSLQCSGFGRATVSVSTNWPHEKIPGGQWQVPSNLNTEAVYIKGIVVNKDDKAYHVKPFRLAKPELKVKNSKRSHILPEISLDECGITKGCYLVPPNCQIQNCTYAMTWRVDGNIVHFEVTGKRDGWVGVGFSDDRDLGKDQYIMCIRPPGIGYSRIENMYAEASTAKPIDPLNPLIGMNSDYRAAYDLNRISCTFSRYKSHPTGLVDHRKIKDLNEPHYVLATFGTQADMVENYPSFNDYRSRPLISATRVDFNREAHPLGVPTGSWLSKVHGALMIIAWVLLASIAMLISRYYRPLWGGISRFSKDSWLAVHQPLVITVAVLSVIAFIFILFEVNWTWAPFSRYLWHSVLGILVIFFSILNVLIAFCVPRYNSRGYCIWFWIHWLISSLAHCLAIPVIFLGMDLPRLDLWDWCSWLLLAWCIFHIITDLILEIHYCMTYRRSYERFEENDSKQKEIDADVRRYPPGYRWKPFCLGLYIVITLAVVVTLIVAIIVYDW